MSRRHNSLIPLSHQHQHALALAVVVRRRFGMEKGESEWQGDMAEKVRKLYDGELKGHFDVEETILFPQMERHLGPLDLVTELRNEHAFLRDLVRRVGQSSALLLEPGGLPYLDEFAALLERHVRTEERRLFPEFEKRMPAQEALKVGREIEAQLTKACPRLGLGGHHPFTSGHQSPPK